MPLVLLVDANSASASEVLAGAFQDNDRALIIGEKTFGKGLVQSVLSLPYGSGLTLTAARYYTPSGRSIQRDYSDVGLYDYFNHRNTTAEIERSAYVARTLTNRVVYGGDGITPDEIAAEDKLTAAQISLLDPLFFFAHELINGRVDNLQTSGVTANQQIRQQVVFGEPTVSDAIIDKFVEFATNERSWKISPNTINRERPYIKKMLRYNLAMSEQNTHRKRYRGPPSSRRNAKSRPARNRRTKSPLKQNKRKRLVESSSQRAKVETGGIRKTVRRRT
jgi:carboxyl-terminal processing protease